MCKSYHYYESHSNEQRVTVVLRRMESWSEADTYTHFSESGRMAPNCILLRATSKGYLNSWKHNTAHDKNGCSMGNRSQPANTNQPCSSFTPVGCPTAALTISSERRHRPRHRIAGSCGVLESGHRDCLKTADPGAPGNVWGRDSSACQRWRMRILESGEGWRHSQTTATSTLVNTDLEFYKVQPQNRSGHLHKEPFQ